MGTSTTVTADSLRAVAAGVGAVPVSVAQLVRITGAPELDFDEVVRVVEHDMALAAAVLGRANSAASSSSHRIENVRDAVVRLGPALTLAAAMHTVVGGMLRESLHWYGYASAELGRHAATASVAGGLIAQRVSFALPKSVPTTALLHDVGKVALDGIALAGLAAPPPPALAGSELAEWEEAELGVDHAYAGAIVAEAWRLPDAIVEGIARHHERVDDPLPSAICLADFIAHCAATDDHDRSVLQSEAESASQILGLQASDVDTLIERTREQVTALAVVTHGSS